MIPWQIGEFSGVGSVSITVHTISLNFYRVHSYEFANDVSHHNNSSILSSEGELFVFGVGRPRLNTGGASKMDSTTYTGTTSNRMQHLFGDDDTLENIYNNANAVEQQHIPPYDEEDSERITVVAPAGKLGIVIDNPGGEVPVVHAIKETSVLHGRVNVGDLLLSVDEQDCRGMSAVAVSKLISSRSENPTRTLVLLRGSGVVS